jgi:hypothetical protein
VNLRIRHLTFWLVTGWLRLQNRRGNGRLVLDEMFVALKLTSVDSSFVPIAVSGDCQNRPFAVMARVAKAAIQIPSLFSLT